MDDRSLIQAEFRRHVQRRMACIFALLTVGVVAILMVPDGRGTYRGPLYPIAVLALVVPFLAITFAFACWIVSRMGDSYATLYLESRRRAGETRLEWYRRAWLAEPSHNRFYVLFVVLGLLQALSAVASLSGSHPQSLGLLMMAVALVLVGGAEFLPTGQVRAAAAFRLLSTAIALASAVIFFSGIFRP